LLYKIADAYFYLEKTMYWEHQFLEAATSTGIAMSVNMSNGTSMPLAQYVWSLTVPSYSPARQSVAGALAAIDRASKR
jgi:hypothetical protein